MKRRKSRGTWVFVLVVAVLAAAVWGAGPGGWLASEEVEALQGAAVRRGDLSISEVARGNLEAKDSVRVVNELEGRATIIYLADEGTLVQEGDLVCELDISDLRDRRVSQEIAVRNAEAEFTKAREQYDIQEIENQSDFAEAELDLQLAELDLEKYVIEDGEWTNEKAQAEETIKIAEEELKQAETTFEWSEKLASKGFLQRSELDRDRLSVERARINVEQAMREKNLKVAYGNKRRMAELQAAVETSRRNLRKAEKQARARLADYEAARESARAKLDLERGKLEKLDDQISKGRIVASEGGMLIYSRTRRGMMGGGEVPEEGGEVHERQEIATIPRTGGMIANASLHETKLEKVRVGQRCRITVDALPGQVFGGEVAFIAAVADSGSWLSNPNQRLYRTEVSLAQASPEMRPGMSCNIEFLIDHLQDVLYVPRSSVFLDGGRTVCFIKQNGATEPRGVEVGQDNNKWVEISSGLEEGEKVLLSPPASWKPAPPSSSLPGGMPAADRAPTPSEGGAGAPVAAGAVEGSRSGADRAAGAEHPTGDASGRREGGSGGDPAARWRGMGGDGKRPTPEQIEEMMKNMSPEMRERVEAMRKMRRGDGGG